MYSVVEFEVVVLVKQSLTYISMLACLVVI